MARARWWLIPGLLVPALLLSGLAWGLPVGLYRLWTPAAQAAYAVGAIEAVVTLQNVDPEALSAGHRAAFENCTLTPGVFMQVLERFPADGSLDSVPLEEILVGVLAKACSDLKAGKRK